MNRASKALDFMTVRFGCCRDGDAMVVCCKRLMRMMIRSKNFSGADQHGVVMLEVGCVLVASSVVGGRRRRHDRPSTETRKGDLTRFEEVKFYVGSRAPELHDVVIKHVLDRYTVPFLAYLLSLSGSFCSSHAINGTDL